MKFLNPFMFLIHCSISFVSIDSWINNFIVEICADSNNQFEACNSEQYSCWSTQAVNQARWMEKEAGNHIKMWKYFYIKSCILYSSVSDNFMDFHKQRKYFCLLETTRYDIHTYKILSIHILYILHTYNSSKYHSYIEY